VNSLSKQIKFSYGVVKKMASPFSLTLASCGHSSRIRVALDRFGAENWTTQLRSEDVQDIFQKEVGWHL